MQEIERTQRHEVAQWAHTNPNIAFVRNGAVGESRQRFTAEQFAEFEACHGEALTRLGYDLMTPAVGAVQPAQRPQEVNAIR
jgi:hypothetical protein